MKTSAGASAIFGFSGVQPVKLPRGRAAASNAREHRKLIMSRMNRGLKTRGQLNREPPILIDLPIGANAKSKIPLLSKQLRGPI